MIGRTGASGGSKVQGRWRPPSRARIVSSSPAEPSSCVPSSCENTRPRQRVEVRRQLCEALREAGGLLAASADYKHSYPHSWRSKAKVIFRCTPQWFVPMDKAMTHLPAKTPAEKRWENEGGAIDPRDEVPCASPTLREAAMTAIAATRFVPEKGRNRIGSMVEGRPDWVLSRQRAWGVPITLFVNRKTGQYLSLIHI